MICNGRTQPIRTLYRYHMVASRICELSTMWKTFHWTTILASSATKEIIRDYGNYRSNKSSVRQIQWFVVGEWYVIIAAYFVPELIKCFCAFLRKTSFFSRNKIFRKIISSSMTEQFHDRKEIFGFNTEIIWRLNWLDGNTALYWIHCLYSKWIYIFYEFI